MNIVISPIKKDWNQLLERPTKSIDDIESLVLHVFSEVKEQGDSALLRYTSVFDKVDIPSLQVSEKEIRKACNLVSEELKNAIAVAKTNIEKFHNAQKSTKVAVETTKGVSCWQEKRPISEVGLYIPGGTAPLFSTVLMLAIPAKIAGCKEIVICTPPNASGEIPPAILYAAQLCGVTKIFKVGGIQAVAGMTLGTQSIPKVSKIFGPGNQYVTIAKQVATKFGVAIDMPAGPSELMVFADTTANADFVASDLLSQAEHGADSQVILVTTSKNFISNVSIEIEKQLKELPRIGIAQEAMTNSKLIYVNSKEIAMELINVYAPEHLIICSENEDYFLENIQNAGSVFIGNYTPESAGDYASGTNHTLPTNGFSKAYSGVNLDSFLKSITFQKITREGIQRIGKSIEIMAEAEGLQAHKNAVSLRLEEIRKSNKISTPNSYEEKNV